jgi:hypothetical protein
MNFETKFDVATRLGWTTEGLRTNYRRGARGFFFFFSKTTKIDAKHNQSSIQQILGALFPGSTPDGE